MSIFKVLLSVSFHLHSVLSVAIGQPKPTFTVNLAEPEILASHAKTPESMLPMPPFTNKTLSRQRRSNRYDPRVFGRGIYRSVQKKHQSAEYIAISLIRGSRFAMPSFPRFTIKYNSCSGRRRCRVHHSKKKKT